MDINDLIATIARNYKQKIGIAPAKTKLLKLVYISEIYYKRITGKRLTNQQWVFWKHGPYLWQYDEVISNQAIFLLPDEIDEFHAVSVREDYQTEELNIEEYNAVNRALEHASSDLNQLLDFVYFDTEPMMETQVRGDVLDFDTVMPEEFYSVKHYRVEKKQGQKILEKIRKWEARVKRS